MSNRGSSEQSKRNKSGADEVLPEPWIGVVSLAGGRCRSDPPPGLVACSQARWAGLGEGGPFCPGLERQSCLVTMLLGRKDVPVGSTGLLVRVTHSPSPVFHGDQPAWFVFCFAP